MSSRVAVVGAGDDLAVSVDEALEACGMGDCVRPGNRVLVKPNLHGGAGHTSPEMMAAACRWAFGRGAREVVLGDGPFWGLDDVLDYFERAGVLRACRDTGATAVNFHEHPFRLHHPASPDVPPVLGVSRLLYECDVIINLPVMKTHLQTMITIALKNVKGCLRPMDKRRLHEMELNAALGVVNEIIQPLVTVHLCDATTAYEGMGPGSGTPVPMELLLASGDPVALDVVACRLMGIDPATVRLIRECADRGLGIADEDAIEVVGERVEEHARRFVRPFEALGAKFPGLTLHSSGACTGCSLNLLNALAGIAGEGGELACRSILIGPGPQTEADVLIGDCALRGKQARTGLRGCPPLTGDVFEYITHFRRN